MPVNRDYLGREYRAREPYEVSRETIRSFADAIGDPHPAYRDVDAARALGHPDVVAPPTFLTVLQFRFADDSPVADPGFGLDFRQVVHGEQRFVHHRPVHAGDRVVLTTTVQDIRTAGRNEVITTRQDIAAEDGARICTAYSTLVARGTAAGGRA